MAAFLSMGGYAVFVWPSFGITALVLLGLAVLSVRRARANEAALKALDKGETSRDETPG
jgi:heme exporter protein D